MNVVVGQRMAERVASFKIPPQRIRIIHNWSDDDQVVPIAPEDNPLRREWGLQDHFVFGYSGNLGRAHEFDTVLATAETLRDNPTIVFLFVGGGHQLRNLAQHVKDRGLTNFRFIDYQDRSVLKYSLCVPDAHWISLRPALEGLIVPSKFYGIAAAGRPIVAICKQDGEIATMVEQHHCGFVIEPGNFTGLTQVLLKLSCDASLRAVLGARARAMLDASLKRDLALGHWQRMVEQLD
jgi:glycosyltransferase involved in cell wall biosynthesis